MYKLIILLGPVSETASFREGWPEFLHQAEGMPGLEREATVQVQNPPLFGDQDIRVIHELFFENQNSLQRAMASPPGQAAGQILQKISGGDLTLLIAEHKEDSGENLRKYSQESSNADTQ